jgi:hypothetical protein
LKLFLTRTVSEGTEQSQCDSISGRIYLCIRMNSGGHTPEKWRLEDAPEGLR